ncbi:thermostable hemolysin [Patescibacteria group bacterium]|nr:thermostable hemolysin [Patescibacteria group bacterium]
MLEIGVSYPTDHKYIEICRFAQDVYLDEFEAHINPRPDVFVYATSNEQIVGCFGLYRARDNQPLLFETYIENAYEKLVGGHNIPRLMLGELGTRVVKLPKLSHVRSSDVSLSMTAVIVSIAYQLNIRHVGFTTTRLVKRITDALGFKLVILGAPELSNKDAAFRKNWHKFFQVPQVCAGFSISSLDGCRTALRNLESKKIFAPPLS